MDGNQPDDSDLIASYLLAKVAIVEAGFEGELAWQERRRVEAVDERLFLAEAAWVVLSSGMRESVVRKVFPAVEAAFQNWSSAAWIVEHALECKRQAALVFRHERKLDAVVQIARAVAKGGLGPIIAGLRKVGPDSLTTLPYMGPATSKHLAKNLGIDVAKPDRHLLRVAEAVGYESPASFCAHLANAVGDTVAVVDLVVWRFATLSDDYLDFFCRRRSDRPLMKSPCRDAPSRVEASLDRRGGTMRRIVRSGGVEER